MSTLFDQPQRKFYTVNFSEIDEFLSSASKLSKKHGISITEVIAAKTALELERRNDLYAANGDAFDEQIAGIGELLQALSSAIESLRENSI
jgi:hypothetical protein